MTIATVVYIIYVRWRRRSLKPETGKRISDGVSVAYILLLQFDGNPITNRTVYIDATTTATTDVPPARHPSANNRYGGDERQRHTQYCIKQDL